MLPAGVDSQKDREHLRNCSKAKNTAFGGEKRCPRALLISGCPQKKKNKKQWPRAAVHKISESVRKNYGPK